MLGRLCPASSSSRYIFLQVGSILQVQTAEVHHHNERHDLPRFIGVHRSNKAKANRNTHVNEKMFRKMRGRKTLIPNFDYDEELAQEQKDREFNGEPALTPAEIRQRLLSKGINPYKEVSPRSWQESQVSMQSFYGVVDPYVPPEKLSSLVNFKGDEVKDWGKNLWHNYINGTRRIRKKAGMDKFNAKTFGPTAEDVYINAHKALMERNKTTLHRFITEAAFAKMWPDVETGSIVWNLVEWMSPSTVVSIRCADHPPKSGNDIAQLIVRMHSKQTLAIFDRFGHLIRGSETEPKEVIEYVVFENHIAVVDGVWRLHDKVTPKWNKKDVKDGSQQIQGISDNTNKNPPLEPPTQKMDQVPKEQENR